MMTIWQPPSAQTAKANEYVLASDVILVLAQDGSARLLDMGGGFYALPAIGAQMLQGVLERGCTVTAVELAEHYQTSVPQVQADLIVLLDQLHKQGLLQHGSKRRRASLLVPTLVLAPCLRLVRSLCAGRLQAAALLTLAYLSLAWFGWARTVAVWQRHVRRTAPGGTVSPDEQTVKALDQAVRQAAASHPLRMACKERALSCWALVRWTGVPATLVVGLDLFPLAGHCWCEVGSWTLSDQLDTCQFFTPVIRYV